MKRGRKAKPAPDFVVTADVYNGVEVGVFRDLDCLKAWCRATRLEVDESFNSLNTNALAGCDTDPDGVAWFFTWIRPHCPAWRVCHECLHLAWHILDDKGIEVTADNHEALAYLQQHLARQILSHR